MKHKFQVSSTFVQFVTTSKNQFGVNIKRIRSDNDRDYFNLEFNFVFQEEGIIREYSCVSTPQQNGIAERKNGHVLEQTRAVLFQYHVPKKFWEKSFLLSLISSIDCPLKS